MAAREEVAIQSRDYWFKVVDMLQQNWALVDERGASGVTVFFVHDRSGVFDRLEFSSHAEAEAALAHNGFRRYAEDPGAKRSASPPPPPFVDAHHPNGPIYSSGRFWL